MRNVRENRPTGVIAYLGAWFGEFRSLWTYRNTLICMIVICLVWFLGFYHAPYKYHKHIDGWFMQYRYRLPVTQLYHALIFLIIPLFSLIFLKPSNRCGLRLGHWKRWIGDVVPAYVVILILILIVGRRADFLNKYPLYKPAATSWRIFLWYELIHLTYMFGWEFLFRGYMLFATEKELGRAAAVIVQCLPFALLHAGKPELEAIGSIVAGLYLGILALRANSMLPCAILHFSAALTMDVVAILGRSGHGG